MYLLLSPWPVMQMVFVYTPQVIGRTSPHKGNAGSTAIPGPFPFQICVNVSCRESDILAEFDYRQGIAAAEAGVGVDPGGGGLGDSGGVIHREQSIKRPAGEAPGR